MKICEHLIVGGDSKLGKALIVEFKENNLDFLYTSRKKGNGIYLDALKLDDFDIPLGVKYLYWFIAETNTKKCEIELKETALVNVNSIKNIIKKCNNNNVKLIFPSTSLIFSGEDKIIESKTECKPVCEYGKQKCFAEQLIINNCNKYAIIRFGKILDSSDLFFLKWKEELLKENNISAFFDLYLAPTIMKDSIKFLIYTALKTENEIKNYSASTQISYYDAGLILAKMLNVDTKYVTDTSCFEYVKHKQNNVVLTNNKNIASAEIIMNDFLKK